jgi:hypothetical protein
VHASVTTALPTLGRVFGRADISSWVGTAYLLTSTVSVEWFVSGTRRLILVVVVTARLWQVVGYLWKEGRAAG